jgi:hypothetical protein
MNCEIIPVIPQTIETCWFNAIMMAMLYSDRLSQFVYEKAVEDNWHLDENGAFKTIMLLFMNYIRTIKKNGDKGLIKRFGEFINKYKIELILLDYLNHYHSKLNIHEIIRKGLYVDFLFDMLKGLKLDIDIIYSKDNSKYNIKYDYKTGEYIIKDDELVATNILLCRNMINEDMSVLSPIREDYFRNFGEEQMFFLGEEYKLESILIYDKNLNHIITGLTCNGSKYVYNGWLSQERKSPCNLMPFDWNGNIYDFCLDYENCELPRYEYPDYRRCFNFKDNERILVYVKVKDNKKVSRKQVKMIKFLNIYKHIDEYDKDEIINILRNIYKIGEEDLDKLSLEKMRVLLRKKLREKLFEGISGNNKKLKKLKLDLLLGSEKDLSSVYSNISKIIKITFQKLIKSNDSKYEELKENFNELISENPLNQELYEELELILIKSGFNNSRNKNLLKSIKPVKRPLITPEEDIIKRQK